MSAAVRRVLVTGGTGFIGSRVVRQLLAQGHEVAVLIRHDRAALRISDLLLGVTVVRGDLSELSDCAPEMAAFRPDSVLHLGWQGVEATARNSPVQLGNVTAAIALFELAQELGCTRFVGLGSQAEYGPVAGRIREDTSARPTTVYGAAKLALGILLQRQAEATGLSFAWLRLFSCYGPGADPAWLIPYLISKLLARERPSLTAAEQMWDYLYVDDAATAVVAALDTPNATGAFNLGSGQARPLRAIVELVRDAIDPSLPLGFGEQSYRSDQVMHLEADISALTAATGWQPRISLEQGIAQTVAWYRQESLHAL